MVNIPTARDVGYNNPRSGRIANSGPTPMVGAAMQDAGQSIVQASYSLLELAEREKIDVANDRSNVVSTNLTRFLADEEQRFLKAREKSSESGIGFTRQFMEGYQQRADAFAKENFEGLTENAQTGYLNNILSSGNSLFAKADDYERKAKSAYYDRTTNTNLDTLRTQIQNNAGNFEDLKRKGHEDINSANMPEPWKAERRQNWDADAAESKWRWKFARDPKEALGEISGAGGDDAILAAIEDTESAGVAGAVSSAGAVGLMQVMPETGAEIAAELGDKSFPANGTLEEQKAYLKDEAVSRRYGAYHYNKMLTRYDGDQEAALIAYNGGQVRGDAWLAAGRDDAVLPKETADYYKKVLSKAKVNTFTSGDASQAKVFLLGRTGKDASHIEGMDDGFSVKLSRLIQAAPAGIREKLGIYSGARSVERQAELWAAAVKRYGSPEAARKWVAPPGKSNHNHGKAADLSYNGQSLKDAPAEVVQWVHANAGQFGLKFPLANENWHIEDGSTRGGKARPVDPDLAAIPYERRRQLQSWGEAEYNQQVTKDRATTKDNYNLLIATKPETVRESVILDDPKLDNGDKAVLVNALRTAQKDSGAVNAMIGAMASGKVEVNPFDKDQTKVADNTYDKLIAAAKNDDERRAITADFVTNSGYVPGKVQAAIRQGVASTDPATFANAMSAADAVERLAPISFGAFEGGTQARDKLAVFRHLVNNRGLSGEEAAKRIIAMDDPAVKAKREVLKPELQKFVKDLSVADVTAMYDPSIFTAAPGAGIVPDHPVGLLGEYREIAEEKFYEMGGDAGSAKAAALAEIKTRWNISNVSGSPNLMRTPPELHYPPIGGSLDYLREDAMKTATDYAAKLGRKVENVAILATDKTRADIEGGGVKAGHPPRYRLFYQYTSGGQTQYDEVLGPPWGVDTATLQKYSDKAGKRSIAEHARQEEASDVERAAPADVSRALEETVGPDWMKARAAEAAREQALSKAAAIRKRPLEGTTPPVKPTFDPEKLPVTFGHAMNDAMWSDDAPN